MTKRKKLWIGAITAFIVLVFIGCEIALRTHSVRLSNDLIQNKINANLPREVAHNVVVDAVQVKFVNDKVLVTIGMHGLKLGKNFSMTAQAFGIPEYREAEGKFYFMTSEVDIKSFTFGNTNSTRETTSTKITKLAERYITNKGVQDAIKDSVPQIDLAVAKAEKWMEEYAEKAAISIINRVPVYSLKDNLKETIVRASLNSVRVEGNDIVVTFSLIKLTMSVVVVFVLALAMIGFMITLARNPKLGIAIEIVDAVAGIAEVIHH